MKKQISILMAAVLMAGTLAGCGSKEAAPETTTAAPATEVTTGATTVEKTTTEAETTAAAGGLKTGMAIVFSMESSKDAGEKDGNAQVDSTIVVVVVDADGKIIECVLDVAQNRMAFIAEGKVIMKDEFKTGQELKEEYNMKPTSGIGKEWYEQAATMEEFVIGKATAEMKGIAVDEDNKPTDIDLAAGCTMAAGDFIEVISQAAESAAGLGTQEGDKLGLGVVTVTNEHIKDTTADAEGQCEAYSTYVATITGADGRIITSTIDCTQGVTKFDATGKITSDLTIGVKTRKWEGEEYGMRAASGIDKEWLEQAAVMEEFITGKTADEVKGIAVDEDSKPTDTNLTAGCTVSIGDFQECVVKAAAIARWGLES